MSNNLSNYGSSYSSLRFYSFFYVLFLSKGNVLRITTKLSVSFFLVHNIVLVYLDSLLLMLSGDVEINAELLSNCKEYLSICHCHWASLAYLPLTILNYFFWKHILYYILYLIILYQKHILICYPTDDDKFHIPECPSIRSDHPFIKQNIPLIQNAMESVYIIEVLYQ